MAYNYIDLFSGAGGLSLGFDNANFKNVLSVEFEPEYAETYSTNFPDHNVYIGDIRNISDQEIKEINSKTSIDVVVGGPPCQGFSKAGNIGRTFVNDERNQLFKEFVRFVRCINPKVFVMENVAALVTHRNGQTMNEIIEAFKSCNIKYDIVYKVLNCSDYEVPQDRRRVFIIGVRNDINNEFKFPEAAINKVTVKEAIHDLPVLKSGETSDIPNHNAMKHSSQMLLKMSYVKDGGSREDIPINLRPKSGDARKYIRYASNKPSVCVTGDMRKIFHYEQNRALTCRELARLQTFPDSFIFCGKSSSIQQQIGNAVPPRMAEKVATNVRKVLDGTQLS